MFYGLKAFANGDDSALSAEDRRKLWQRLDTALQDVLNL